MFLSVLSILLFAGDVFTYPNNISPLAERDDVSVLTTFKGYLGCSKKQKAMLKQDAKDAVKIAKYGLEFDPGGLDDVQGQKTDGPSHYYIDFEKEAALDYFGPRKANAEFQQMIFHNLLAVANSYPGWGWEDWWNDRYITLSCGSQTEYDGCNDLKHPDSPAYNDYKWVEGDPKKRYPLITFCASYFEKLSSHADVVAAVGSDKRKQGYLPNFRSRATTFMHELMHVKQKSSKICPGDDACTDHPIRLDTGERVTAYKPGRTKLLASIDVAAAAYNNDNYAYFATAEWVRKKYGNYPHYPTRWNKEKSVKWNKDKDASDPGAPEEASSLDSLEGGGVITPGEPSAGQPYPVDWYPQYYQPVLEWSGEGDLPKISPEKPDPKSPYYPKLSNVKCVRTDAPVVGDCERAFSTMTTYEQWAFPVPLATSNARKLTGVAGSCALWTEIGPDKWDFQCVPWFRDLSMTFRGVLDKCITPEGTVSGSVPFKKGDCTATLHIENSKGVGDAKVVVPT